MRDTQAKLLWRRAAGSLSTSRGAGRGADGAADKKPKSACLECAGNFCIRKMFNGMASCSQYVSYALFTFLIKRNNNDLRGPVGTILFGVASSVLR